MYYETVSAVCDNRRDARLKELLEHEELEECKYCLRGRTDRDYALAESWLKRIERLAESYWYGQISRDELIDKIEKYNKKKCDDQKEIRIGHVMSVMHTNHKYYDIAIWERNPFSCEKCGCKELMYQKYVSSKSYVYLKTNGTISHCRSRINEDDYVDGMTEYLCKSCGHPLYHCGVPITSTEQLFVLLSMEPEERRRQEKEHEAQMPATIEKSPEEYDEEARREIEYQKRVEEQRNQSMREECRRRSENVPPGGRIKVYPCG